MPHLLALTAALLHLHHASGLHATPLRGGTTLRSMRTTTSKMAADEKYDVVVIGSGPVGSTFARCLSASGEAFGDLNGGKKVLVVDAGKKMSEKTGEHIKNSLLYQSDHGEGKRLFSEFIAGTIEKISKPWTGSSIDNMNPTANQPGCNQEPKDEYKKWNMNLQNPDQESFYNIPDAAISYKVGGQGTHWTCSCPRPHPELEMNALFPSDGLFTMAEELLNVNQDTYANEIRNVLVGDRLKETIDKELDPKYPSQYLPLAVKRVNDQYVDWTGPSVILGDKLAEAAKDDPNFTLKQETICKKLHFGKTADGTGQTVEYAELFNPKTGETTKVYADTFVACCGQVHTAQLLAASGFENDALGRYLCTQPLYFTRLAFGSDFIKRIKAKTYERFDDVINAWQKKNPHDPIPIPRSGKGSGEVQCWIPVQKDRPYHCQLHNDNFHYGINTSPIDDRLVVSLRWFGVPKMSEKNRVTFTAPDNADGYFDMMGMPQPTFHYVEAHADVDMIDAMAKDLIKVAGYIGTPIPDAATFVQFLPGGNAFHLHGCNRIGTSVTDSVADSNCKAWGVNNLYLGGSGIIPKGIGCNPTLTAVALALRASMDILGLDTSDTFHTPVE